MPASPDFYYSHRQAPAEDATCADVAAWLIYVMAMSFNGLFRVNSKGQFNVPIGKRAGPPIFDAANLRLCSAALQSASINHRDFETLVEGAREGDFVYFDPPYIPITQDTDALAYSSKLFRMSDQRRLRNIARSLKERGVHVLISNSTAPQVYELYSRGFQITTVTLRRTISAKPEFRGLIEEALIT